MTASEIDWKHHEYAYIPTVIAMVTIEITVLETKRMPIDDTDEKSFNLNFTEIRR